MRVIAGESGGRRLLAPRGEATRPSAERVRESIFSMLVSLGALEGAVVWDLFSGSGALGIEALSRGAAHATFVDSSRRAVLAARSNLSRLGYGLERAEVVCSDALHWAEGAEAADVDVVFADPPYSWQDWAALLSALERLAPLVVLETGGEVELPAPWRAVRARRYGGTLVTLAQVDYEARRQ
jgi:16S rRNA (guanine966-N2)-methyltransferase